MPRKDYRARAGAALAALLAASCSAPAAEAPKYALSSCKRVALTDENGKRVRGAEDIAVDAVRGRLIVSAHDRRAVARAAGAGAAEPPEGGVYAVSIDDLASGAAAARPLVARDMIAGGLRPHGLVYIPQTDEIAFVNRGYQKLDGRWRLGTSLERISAADGAPVVESKAAHCAANDVLADESGLISTFDHGACGWRRSLEDVFALRRSGVLDAKGAPLFDGASYANGVLDLEDGRLALAATRENALLILRGGVETRRIALPGGPDNLTGGEGGVVIAAVHPSSLKLAAALKLGFGKAPSRVVRIDPVTGKVGVLFDDPSGRTISGATVAVERGGALILGSAIDEGLLYCGADDVQT